MFDALRRAFARYMHGGLDPHEWNWAEDYSRGPVMRRRDAQGAWEYRQMTDREMSDYLGNAAW